MGKEFKVAGYTFGNEKDAALAREEEKKIYYINTKLNWGDPESVLVIYNKMLTKKLFVTPVGLDFMRQLHDKLILSEVITDEELSGVPVFSSYTGSNEIENEPMPVRRVRSVTKVKDYKKEYNICRLIIAVLVGVIIAMFAITANSENPNILNYETKLQDKYAAWSDELTKREDAVREKEKELGIE